eukprot:3274721-Lingulodinium_polyedra.AAC.1
MTGQGDNKGSSFVLAKLYTSRMPAASVVRTIASILARHDAVAELRWCRREENTWADDLSKGRCRGFSPAARRR